jgi:hypothetical protein
VPNCTENGQTATSDSLLVGGLLAFGGTERPDQAICNAPSQKYAQS